MPAEHCYLGSNNQVVISRNALDLDMLDAKGIDNPTTAQYCLLARHYGRLKVSPDFQRIIMKIIIPKGANKGSDVHKYCLVQYRFDGKVHELPSTVHGNAKKRSQPFFTTQHSTRQLIKDAEQDQTRAKVMNKVGEKKGGFLHADNATQLPRNVKQVSNFRSKVNSNSLLVPLTTDTDDLLIIIGECKGAIKGAFVREVTAAPEPTCILATDQQIMDLQRFCCAPRPNNAIMGIDPTFNLGEFYVTCTVLRHYGLQSNDGHPCLFHGPMFIHQKKQYETYHMFASALVRLAPTLGSLKAFGTDGEQALYTSFQSVFQEADHLRCTVHMKKDVRKKLKGLAIPSQIAREFLHDIFGHIDGSTKMLGLIDCSSATDFDSSLSALQSTWDNREMPFTPRHCSPRFYTWFSDNKANDFKEGMLPDIRIRNGLGDPPRVLQRMIMRPETRC